MSDTKLSPVTPSEARKAREYAAVQEVISTYVPRIDRYLSTTAPTGSGEWFFAVNGLHPGAVSALLSMYERAGWVVRMNHDRDGAAIVFKESP